MELPEVVIFDVNETLSDMSALAVEFERAGLAAHESSTWFAGVLRDGFALTVTGVNPDFADLALESLRLRLHRAGHRDDDQTARSVMEAFSRLDVHPDVVEGVRALRAGGIRLVTLSNGATSVADALLTRQRCLRPRAAGLRRHSTAGTARRRAPVGHRRGEADGGPPASVLLLRPEHTDRHCPPSTPCTPPRWGPLQVGTRRARD